MLKPGKLNIQKIEFDQSETSGYSPQLEDFIKIQPVTTGKNVVEFQPISIEKTENELENLWATAKNNDNVYQSIMGAIKKTESYQRF